MACRECGALSTVTNAEGVTECGICGLEHESADTIDAPRARVAELEGRNGYLERRHAEMQKGWDACRSLADSRQSALEAMTETAAEQSRVHVEMHNTIIALNEENTNLSRLLRQAQNYE